MRTEDRVLFLCTRQRFEDRHRQMLSELCSHGPLEWKYVFQTAHQQGVSPLVGLNLSRCTELDVPDQFGKAFRQAISENLLRKQAMLGVLEEILDLFNRKRIDVMLVKGAALSLSLYEQPWFTRIVDIDLVIRSRREELNPGDDRDIRDTLEGINQRPLRFREHIEYDYFAHHDVTMNDMLPVDFEPIWRDARRMDFRGRAISVMTPEDTLIATAVNACRKRFFRLKSLLDVAEIVDRMPIDWAMLATKARASKCSSIVFTALVLTDATLGCALPQEVCTHLSISRIRAALIRRVISLLSRHSTLGGVSHRFNHSLFNRQPSLSLILTYATYPSLTAMLKFGEIWLARSKNGARASVSHLM